MRQGLTGREAEVLDMVASGDERSQAEAAEEMGIKQPNVSRLLKQLEQKGYIKRSGRGFRGSKALVHASNPAAETAAANHLRTRANVLESEAKALIARAKKLRAAAEAL